MGLRERKKAVTKTSIQKCALNLFREHGYHTTTVEQIAQEAGISRRTFFRYFPKKEDVVLHDEYDLRILEAFEAQPPELGPIEALRNAMKETHSSMSDSDLIEERERNKLISSVPELRLQSLNKITQLMSWLTEAVAKRSGRDPDDFATRMFVGAVIGIILSTELYAAEESDGDYFDLVDDALAFLQTRLHM
ncbi:TetR family transcriptional regulator [Camelliibacillus cellulosilyticus]|uniref:TetR family transcriptional regulator n=1 Tax=Camelliibacillus cellulosilyticus TaxID=2174486 RepID=A0ABV9GMT9_9BACL